MVNNHVVVRSGSGARIMWLQPNCRAAVAVSYWSYKQNSLCQGIMSFTFRVVKFAKSKY